MPLTSLSPENKINEILRELDCATSNFTAIAGRLSAGRVAQALAGQSDFAADDAAYYLSVARQMKRLQDEAGIPVDFRKVDRIKDILGTRKRTIARPTPFSVVFIGGKLLKNISSNQIEVTDDYSKCAAFRDFLTARTAAKLLDAMTNDSVRATTVSNESRNPDEFVDRLTDIGFAS